jgi:hypothetical protein
MKTRNLLITLSVAALATLNVMATDTLLSPHASAAQTKTAPSVSADPNLAATGLVSASPRLTESQVKTAAGKSSAVSASLQCTRLMAGTPKAVSACADHPGAAMSCCAVAATK